jgi:hypothetical protein
VTRPQVVHVVPALFGDGGVFGGAERYALELAKGPRCFLLRHGDLPPCESIRLKAILIVADKGQVIF